MKAKLIKTDKSYILEGDNLPNPIRLSFKNCQAIENGYDLDELVIDEIPDSSSTTLQVQRMRFIHGFQKALEILGDKKFSEKDMIRFMQFIISQETLDYTSSVSTVTAKYYLGNFQSLQQTEWQVEVIMDRIPADLAPGGWDVFPKLDAENCLILKRVE